MNRLPNPHPGDVLREDYHYYSVDTLSAHTGLPRFMAQGLLDGTRDVTDYIAMVLARAVGGSKEFWLNLQKAYDEEEGQ